MDVFLKYQLNIPTMTLIAQFFSWGTAHYSSLGAIAEFWLCHEKNIPDSPPKALWHSYVPLLPISSYLQVGFLQSPPPLLLICWWRLIPILFPLKTMFSIAPPLSTRLVKTNLPPHPPLLAVFIDCSLNAKITFFSTGASIIPPGSGGKRVNIVEPK